MHSGANTKIDVKSNRHKSENNFVTSLCFRAGVFKTYTFFMLLRAIIGIAKIELFKVFQQQKDCMQ